MDRIFHIARAQDWAAARERGEYRVSTLGRTLEDEGFIHCSFREQVAGVAAAFYRDEPDLVLLEIDPQLVSSEIRVERPPDCDTAFPHIYGPLAVDAVLSADPFDPAACD